MKSFFLRLLGSVVLAVALLLMGCGLVPRAEEGVDTPPTPTLVAVDPTPEPVDPTPAASEPTPTVPEVPAYITVEVPDAGLAFEVPSDWVRLEPDWHWVPELGSGSRVGMNWMTPEPPQEPEAVMLPSPSEIVSSDPVELAFGTGRRMVLNVFEPTDEAGDAQASVASFEVHVLVIVAQGGVRYAFDFFASAPDVAGLEMIEPVLQHMVETAMLEMVEADVADVIRERVAQELGVPAEDVRLGELVPMDWPDACLGLPAEDEMCALVTALRPPSMTRRMRSVQMLRVRMSGWSLRSQWHQSHLRHQMRLNCRRRCGAPWAF
jgi:hypothetical protein